MSARRKVCRRKKRTMSQQKEGEFLRMEKSRCEAELWVEKEVRKIKEKGRKRFKNDYLEFIKNDYLVFINVMFFIFLFFFVWQMMKHFFSGV